jgi:hypothetical protein
MELRRAPRGIAFDILFQKLKINRFGFKGEAADARIAGEGDGHQPYIGADIEVRTPFTSKKIPQRSCHLGAKVRVVAYSAITIVSLAELVMMPRSPAVEISTKFRFGSTAEEAWAKVLRDRYP